MALFVGFFFGSQFLGVEYMRLCNDGLHSCNGMIIPGATPAIYIYIYNIVSYFRSPELDYIFGHYSGILLSSTLWFVIYCVMKKNKPQVYPKIIVPGLISGIMWGIAMGKAPELIKTSIVN